MKSIVLIIPYFGKWPLWFEAHLKSIEKNTTINWLCPTDCEIPANYPKNVKFLETSLPELNKHVNQIVEAKVPLNARKFCDLKPAYADIFRDEVELYDYWGFCDMDIIWGDIRSYMTEGLLDNYDIISSRKNAISGHFNLFRNTPQINQLYKKLPDYNKLFEASKGKFTDEVVFTQFIKESQDFKAMELKVYWDTILCNQERGIDSHQEYHLDRWLWDNGKMINSKTREEVMYLHFINWKRTMKFSEIKLEDDPKQFYISCTGMHYYKHLKVKKKLWSFMNIFDGYYIREKRRLKLKKVKSLETRIKRKLNF